MKVLILGAAGFIGSNLVDKLLVYGYEIIAADGFLDKAGGSIKNIKDTIKKIDFIDQRIEDIQNLSEFAKKE